MFKNFISFVNREAHIRPVIWASVLMAGAGYAGVVARFYGTAEPNSRPYVDQNEVNMRTLIERELNAELLQIFALPPEKLPVAKRHIWQMGNEAEKVFHKLNDNAEEISLTTKTDPKYQELQKTQKDLYQAWRAQIFDLYWTMAEQRGVLNPDMRRHAQLRQTHVQGLPDAIPYKVRPFPKPNTLFRDITVQAPAPDAPREEFVKYYALRYKVDL